MDIGRLTDAAQVEAGEVRARLAAAIQLSLDDDAAVCEATAQSAWQLEPRIEPFLTEYERFFDVGVIVSELRGRSITRLTFPADGPADHSFFELPAAFIRRSESSAYVRSLGFDWNDAGIVRTVPLPVSFRAVRRQLRLEALGFCPVVVTHRLRHFVREPWLRACLERRLAVNVVPRGFYRATRPLRARALCRLRSVRQDWTAHFTTLGHDMSVHALGTHLVPRSILEPFADRLRGALSRARSNRAVEPLTLFYDSDLYLVCRAIWRESEGPLDVLSRSSSRSAIEELAGRLEARLAQSAAA